MKTTPYYRHDCPNCIYLGSVTAGGRNVDLYYCEKGDVWPTVMARYSSVPEDTACGMVFGDLDADHSKKLCGTGTGTLAELVVARELAVRKGLYKPKEKGGRP